MLLSIVFPGQGSQAIGMMSDLAEHHGLVKDLFVEASDILGVDLWEMTQQGPLEALSQTENTQPALLTAGVAAWRVWQSLGGATPAMMAGHSLGEYTALVSAGAISFADGVALVRDRGRYMQEAVPAGEGGMAAILGLEDDRVREVCTTAAQGDVLQAVNFNAPGQVVIAGTRAAIERGIEQMKEAGARRAMPLPVSIPAHSSLMSSASARLAERIATVELSMPSVPVIHNCNVQVAQSTEQIADNLVTQLDSPVRWVESIQSMHQAGVETFIESGPGRVLGGMIKRIVSGVSIACIEKADAYHALIGSESEQR
ncbi:MAG: ACP S-malonyltransferase [Gammaproteobacteria bacterium]|nr:ACP S-malonyltransferase [Gammaproteobacteria bacterium]